MTASTEPSYAGRLKYDERAARKYQIRKQAKNAAELRLVDRAFARIPRSHRVLDIPCGGGRITLHLAEAGYAMSAADLSDAMITIARQNVARHPSAIRVEQQDLERLTFADRSFDTIICFRLFHHFPTPEIRLRVVNELTRVARQYVVLSYFSPFSATSVKRSLQSRLGGKKSDKHATPLREVNGYFVNAAFKLVKDFAQLPLLHTLHLALFERTSETKP
jgi:ubiquinone/menaquinone biosynthesis C-methylase UbiE